MPSLYRKTALYILLVAALGFFLVEAYTLLTAGDRKAVQAFHNERMLHENSSRAATTGDLLISEINLTVPNDRGIINAEQAAIYIDGTVVAPGDTFSYNAVVGERTPERGFVEGPSVIYSGGKYIMGKDIGGGICRLSTAIHQAVLQAELPFIERHSHSVPVEYAVPGEDAAVSWGSWDYRFLNNRSYPIRIEAKVSGNTVNVELYRVTR